MRKNERMRKCLSILLCVLMLVQYVPTTALAVDAAEGGLCDHHTEHTADCGYVEAVAGSDCTHVHDELCGYAEAVAEVLCDCVAAEDGTLTHVEGCGYVEGVAGSDCTHTHGDCGYAAPAEAKPCTYHCDICLGHDHSEEEKEEQDTTAPPSDATEPAPVCDCGTDDVAIHATNCAAYVAPEKPECKCVEKCTEVNEWCDICGFDVTACEGGADEGVPYADAPRTSSEAMWGTDADNLTGGSGTLAEAFTAAKTDNSITYIQLQKNVTTDSGYSITSGVFTLDLNGKTLTASNYYGIAVSNSATVVTLTDTATNGGGAVNNTYDVGFAVEATTFGKLVIDGGSYSGLLAAVSVFGGIVQINDGTFTSGQLGQIAYDDGTLDLSGCDEKDLNDLTLSQWTGSDMTVPNENIILPEGFVFKDSTSTITTLANGTIYTIAEAPTYAITISDSENGKVEANKTAAPENDTVTLTVTTDKGFVVGQIIVTNVVETSEIFYPELQQDGTYTFTMPAGAVIVNATFMVCPEHVYGDDGKCTLCGAECEHSFDDKGFCMGCDAYQPAELVEDVYQIGNSGQFFWFAQQINGGLLDHTNAVLTDNINLENKEWTPIGTSTYAYTGHFDGRGHTVSGLRITSRDAGSMGLFGKIQSAGVRNLTVSGSIYVNGESGATSNRYGLLIADMTDSIVYNSYTAGSIDVTPSLITGGLVGYAGHSVIINSGSSAAVHAGQGTTYVGGLVGYMTAGNDFPLCLLNSYSTGSVTGSSTSAGGLVGYLADDAVNNYFSGTFNGSATNKGVLFGEIGNNISSSGASVPIVPVIEKNYYISGTPIGSAVEGLDATGYAETYSDGADLLNKLNSNLKIVEEIISGHRGYLEESQWAELVELLDGTSIRAFHWRMNGEVVQCSGNGTISEWTPNDDGLTHTGASSCCGTTVTKNHTFDATTGKCVCGLEMAQASVTKNGTTTYHETLGGAIQAVSNCNAADNAEVKLLKTIDLGGYYQVIYSGVFTLDLNGNKYMSELQVGDSANITITDSVGSGGIDHENGNGVYVIDGGTVTIDDVSIIGHTGVYADGSNVTIRGGSITAAMYGVYANHGSTVTIQGGSISGDYYDLFGDVLLTMAEGETQGTIFPDGLRSGKELNDILDEGLAYWQDGGQVDITDYRTEITGGDVTVKKACDHSTSQHTTATNTGDGTHSFTCTVCNNASSEACSGGTATCYTFASCDKCGAWYGELAEHTPGYTASGDTITETCQVCRIVTGTATIVAEDATYTGEAYTGAYMEYNWMGGEPTIRYNTDNGFTPVNAGTYTVSITYGNATASDTFTINPKDIANCNVSLSESSFPYSGKAPELTVNAVDNGVGSYKMEAGIDYTVGTVAVNAGSHKLAVTGMGNYEGSVELDYTINAKEVSITGAKIQPVTYDPDGYTLTVTDVTFSGVVEGETLDYSASATLTTNAVGEQDATVSVILSNSNYVLKQATVLGKVTIIKATPAIITAPSKEDLTYNGNEQALVKAGLTTDGTMKYSLDGENWNDSIPTGTNAGEYTVWYYVDGDNNHDDSAKASVNVTINRKAVTVTVNDATKKYGEPDPTLTYEAVGLVPGETLTGTLSRDAGENVRSYAISQGTLTNETNPNYDITFMGGGYLTINPTDDYTEEVTQNQDVIRERGEFVEPVYTGINNKSVVGTLVFTYGGSEYHYDGLVEKLKTLAADTTVSVGYTFTPTDSNYAQKTGTLNLTIHTVKFTVNGETVMGDNAIVRTGTPVYGDILGDRIFISAQLKAELLGETDAAREHFSLRPGFTAQFSVGTHTVQILYNGTLKGITYENVVVCEFEITVAPKSTTVTVPENVELDFIPATVEEVIGKLPATVVNNNPALGENTFAITWRCDSLSTVPNGTSTFAWSITDEKFSNYTADVTSGTITVTNGDAYPVTNTGIDKEITYNGSTYHVADMFQPDTNAGEASYAIIGGTGVGTLDGSELTITKAGTIVIKMTTAAQGNYAAGEATATLTVNKGTYEITVSIEGWTYGEEPNAPTSDGPGDVTYTYDNSAGALGGTEPPTDAGMWVVLATYTGNDLYKDGWEFVWFTIEQKELTPSISGSVSKIYDGTTTVPDGLSITLSGVITGDDVSATATYAYESADAGTTKINAAITLSGEDAKNYKLKSSAISADVGEITKAEPIYKAPTVAAPRYNGNEQALISGGSATGGKLLYSLDNQNWSDTIPTGKNAGNYIVYYKVVGDNNHNDNDGGAVPVTIAKAEVTITAKDQTITYGENISGTEITAAGLVDGHSVTVTLTPSTANVTVDGTITPSAAVITANGTDVTDNYNVSYTSGNLVIEPDTSKIDALTTENVTSANEADIEAVQEMMENADSVKEEWIAISTTCEDLIDKIEAVEAENARITDAAADFDLNTVKSSDEAAITALIADIDEQLATNNLTDEERSELENLKTKCNNLIAKIDGTETLIGQLDKTVDDLNAETVKSTDKEALEQVIADAETLIDSGNVTDAEKEALVKIQEDAEALIEKIEAVQDATDTDATQKVEDVTAENVKPEDKEALKDAKADLEKALEDNAGNYTEEEKKAIQDEIQRIEDAIKALENAQDVTDAITQLPETVEPDDEETAEKILDAKEAYNELTDHEKSLVDETTKKKLVDLVAALTAYDIIEGDGGKWTKGSSYGLSFTANGPFSKFVGVEVDGKEVDAEYYDVEAGSTIITLKQSFLKRLSTGEHTITVLYTDGETSGTFKILAESSTPATGDNFNIMLWSGMLCVSALGLIALLADHRRRRSAK